MQTYETKPKEEREPKNKVIHERETSQRNERNPCDERQYEMGISFEVKYYQQTSYLLIQTGLCFKGDKTIICCIARICRL